MTLPRKLMMFSSLLFATHGPVMAASEGPDQPVSRPPVVAQPGTIASKVNFYRDWKLIEIDDACTATLEQNNQILIFMLNKGDPGGTLVFSGPNIPAADSEGKQKVSFLFNGEGSSETVNMLGPGKGASGSLIFPQSSQSSIDTMPDHFRFGLAAQGETIFEVELNGFADVKRWLYECSGRLSQYEQFQRARYDAKYWAILNDDRKCTAVWMHKSDRTIMVYLGRDHPERLSIGVNIVEGNGLNTLPIVSVPGTYQLGNSAPVPTKFEGKIVPAANGQKTIGLAAFDLADLSIMDLPDGSTVTLSPDGVTPLSFPVNDIRAAADYALNCKTVSQMQSAAQ